MSFAIREHPLVLSAQSSLVTELKRVHFSEEEIACSKEALIIALQKQDPTRLTADTIAITADVIQTIALKKIFQAGTPANIVVTINPPIPQPSFEARIGKAFGCGIAATLGGMITYAAPHISAGYLLVCLTSEGKDFGEKTANGTRNLMEKPVPTVIKTLGITANVANTAIINTMRPVNRSVRAIMPSIVVQEVDQMLDQMVDTATHIIGFLDSLAKRTHAFI